MVAIDKCLVGYRLSAKWDLAGSSSSTSLRVSLGKCKNVTTSANTGFLVEMFSVATSLLLLRHQWELAVPSLAQ